MIKSTKNLLIFITNILLISVLLSSTTFSVAEVTTTNSSKPVIDPKIVGIIEMVNETILRTYIQELVNIGPRVTGTYGCEKAAEYIYQQFKNAGLKTRYQYWQSLNNRIPLRFLKDKNVEATHYGTDQNSKEVIVFNAHYDSVKVSPGANDDGSGVAAVLTAAYILSKFEFNRTIKFVTFSGEEQGLLGSRAYAKEAYEKNEDILVEFNADMIGYAKTAQGGRNVSLSFTQDAKWIVDEIKSVNDNYGINFNVKKGWEMKPGGPRMGSDFHDFILYGYESVAFWQSEFDATYHHNENDTIEHVNFSYLINVTKIIVGSLAHLADMKISYPRIRIETPKHGKLYFEDRILKTFRYDKTIVVDDVLIHADVKEGDAPIEKVDFYYDNKLVFTDTTKPYHWRINKLSFRKHNVKVVVHDEMGRNASDEINLYFINLNRKR
ncbi:MAG: M28 family peptidase [Candidatus Thermoplasmatota archaeon]|jgi:aminopeptidase YwaD|nr:M28 family peptidase [Candidatus Thermoplasmatota archaeon]